MVKMEEEPPTKPDLAPAIGQEILTLDTDWRSPIIDFIKNNKSYPKGMEHKKLARRSRNYVVIGTELFRYLRQPRRRLHPRGKSLPIRLLLAHGSGRCP